jgi:protocatechuate 3,4-dioxygenase beta subunit
MNAAMKNRFKSWKKYEPVQREFFTYSRRPPHIHIRVTASGFKTLITQHYPKNGSNRDEFDLVLIPG